MWYWGWSQVGYLQDKCVNPVLSLLPLTSSLRKQRVFVAGASQGILSLPDVTGKDRAIRGEIRDLDVPGRD